MDSLPVTLIVKAPNQQIEDQKIRCETSWTINKLKLHLSEVYPSKPPHHEQKLIYSGQLLNDSVILKDVLRQYEGQDTHTVHLVCTPRHTKMASSVSRPNRQSIPVSENASSGNTPSPESTTHSTTGANNVSPETTQQSRRETENNRVPPAFPGNGFPWVNFHNGEVPPMDLNTLNQYQMQMAWMQQAYMQYMAQYMQMASGQAATTTYQPYTVPTPPNVPLNQQNAQPNQPEAAPAAPQPNPAVAQENEERDWLDVFYMLSSTMILFSVVYLYSSPIRFFFVMFLGFFLYLYQTGHFRNININNNNINGTPEGAAPEEQAPTRLTVAWTFITTFFASLIPEIPNINA